MRTCHPPVINDVTSFAYILVPFKSPPPTNGSATNNQVNPLITNDLTRLISS